MLHDLTGRGDSGLPVVAVVHPGVLAATVYRRLADELAVDHDMFVLDLTGLPEYWRATMGGGRDLGGVTVEAAVERLAAVLAERAAGAPSIVLVGWSLGGTLAYELARQAAAGENDLTQPLDLLLLDSMGPRERLPDDLSRATPALLSCFAMYLGAKRGSRLRLPEERFATASVEEGLATIRDAAADQDLLAAETPLVGLRKLYDTYVDGLVRNTLLTSRYRSPTTTRPLTLIKPEGSLRPASADLGWSALARGELRVHTSPGDHYTMLADPRSVAIIAGLVREQTEELLGRPMALATAHTTAHTTALATAGEEVTGA